MKRSGHSLDYASYELRSDRDVVFEAVRQRADSLRFALKSLQSDTSILPVAASSLAVVGSLAPVYSIAQIDVGRDDISDVLLHTMAGTGCVARVGAGGTLNDLAKALVERHGSARHVFVVLLGHGPVTPWESQRRVADIVDCS